MSKRLRHDLTYDAPVFDVAAMLADPAFREDVCDYQRVISKKVTITPKGGSSGGMDVVIDMVQPARGIPGFAQKFVGDTINIVQSESWSSPTQGQISIAIPGKPGDMSGTAVLKESGSGTVETVDLTVKVNIPLVGGKLEGLIAGLLEKALVAENTVGREWLSR
jgi:hypothetical protein